MAKIHLTSLSLQAFRSFVEKTNLDFSDSGMWLFEGKNLETGGSSGSGKSSVLLAISYVLGFCKFPGTALQSWHTEEPMEVSATFRKGDDELEIVRGSKLSLKLNGKKVAGGAKQLEEKIAEFFGLSIELLAALTYRGQKQPGLFLSRTDSEKKEFLTALLGLEKFEVAYEQSQVKAKALEITVEAERRQVDSIKARLSQVPELVEPNLTDIKPLELAVATHEATLERGKAMVTEHRAHANNFKTLMKLKQGTAREEAAPKIVEVEEALAAAMKAPVQPESIAADMADAALRVRIASEALASFEVAEKKRRQETDALIAAHQRQRQTYLTKLAQRPSLIAKMGDIKAQIVKLESNTCPTCEREWNTAQALTEKLYEDGRQILEQVKGLDALQAELEAHDQNLPAPFEPNEVELKRLQDALTFQRMEKSRTEQEALAWSSKADKEQRAIIAETRAKLSELLASVREKEAAIAAEFEELIETEEAQAETLSNDMETVRLQLTEARTHLSQAKTANSLALQNSESIRVQRERLDNELAAAQEKLTEKERDLKAELDFQQLVGREGFLGIIFDDVLEEIGEETNRILKTFPNTSHVSLEFRSESVSQKGAVKKSITPVVNIGGHEAPMAAGLSGGMGTAVELAVDLAVMEVISRRTGSMPAWLILDESFEGLGVLEKEASLEILRACAGDKLILVVDHASETKEAFGQTIQIEQTNGVSRIAGAL